jgi:large subunit ribosomal protein L21
MAGKIPKTNIVKETSKEFAVIKTGGKQYQVSVGDSVKVEKITGEFKEGDKIVFSEVLLVDNGSDTSVGTPFLAGAKVEATLIEIGKYPKIDVIHYKQKSKYFKKYGHKQPFFKVRIDSIK